MSPDSQAIVASGPNGSRGGTTPSWHGTAASLLLLLVQSLNKSQNELLWLAIVGLTVQPVHERIAYEKCVGVAQVPRRR